MVLYSQSKGDTVWSSRLVLYSMWRSGNTHRMSLLLNSDNKNRVLAACIQCRKNKQYYVAKTSQKCLDFTLALAIFHKRSCKLRSWWEKNSESRWLKPGYLGARFLPDLIKVSDSYCTCNTKTDIIQIWHIVRDDLAPKSEFSPFLVKWQPQSWQIKSNLNRIFSP